MKYAIALSVLAGPAMAHDGAHVHPHDGGLWIGLVVILAGIGLIAAKVRK